MAIEFAEISHVGNSICISYNDDFILFPICHITDVVVNMDEKVLNCTIGTYNAKRTFKFDSNNRSKIYELFTKYLGGI